MIIDFCRLLFRKIIRKVFPPYKQEVSDGEALKLIKEGIDGEKAFLCARLGCTELQTIAFCRLSQKPVIGWMLKPFWNGVIYSIENSSGVFNSTPSSLYKFADLYEGLFAEIDILGTWHQSERFFDKDLSTKKKLYSSQLYPDLLKGSWTPYLRDKKVLVVHPFAETIRSQYEKRKELFDNPDILPDFQSFHVLKAVQSIAGNVPEGFETWFDALDYMRHEMNKIDYDIALIACGAYGFPLGAYAKQCGKKAFVIGGVLQLLFGIKGRRWTQYAELKKTMGRPSWVYPSPDEVPNNIERVPGSGYW